MDARRLSGEESIPFYFGDAQNGSHFTFELCLSNFSPCPKIYFIPRESTARVLAPEDLDYLERKEALSLPADHICDHLLRAYFQHVQPLTPILDIKSFLNHYVSKHPQKPSALLIYSIFFAAANFADASTLEATGFPSRKALKRAMYQRAKALWDAEFEDDKITLIQSAILLSFWYADSTDRAGPWHWAGVAISLCQGLGFHRSLELVVPDSSKIPAYSRLFRRLWWSCFLRDRWLSVTLGRPMRIHLDDCDVLMTTDEDVTHEWGDIPSDQKDRYLPSGYPLLAGCWVPFVKLTDVLGKIMALHYSPTKSRLIEPRLRKLKMNFGVVVKSCIPSKNNQTGIFGCTSTIYSYFMSIPSDLRKFPTGVQLTSKIGPQPSSCIGGIFELCPLTFLLKTASGGKQRHVSSVALPRTEPRRWLRISLNLE
ncbi:Cutinase transcription factor 1 beta [Exophiala dermatitidis]